MLPAQQFKLELAKARLSGMTLEELQNPKNTEKVMKAHGLIHEPQDFLISTNFNVEDDEDKEDLMIIQKMKIAQKMNNL